MSLYWDIIAVSMKSPKDWHHVFIYDPARKEIQEWPLDIKKDLGSILTRLQKGDKVGYPDTEPMKNMASGCFEIRLKGTDGIYRAFYVLQTELGILVFHCFQKKTQKTPKQEIETGKKRLSAFIKELTDEKN
jgi:phage-related protein